MTESRSIDCIADSTLVRYVNQAAHRVFCLCPGVSKALAGTLVAAGQQLGSGAVTIILAEVDFPIAEVSRHAVCEKSIRHGHPPTLHL